MRFSIKKMPEHLASEIHPLLGIGEALEGKHFTASRQGVFFTDIQGELRAGRAIHECAAIAVDGDFKFISPLLDRAENGRAFRRTGPEIGGGV